MTGDDAHREALSAARAWYRQALAAGRSERDAQREALEQVRARYGADVASSLARRRL